LGWICSRACRDPPIHSKDIRCLAFQINPPAPVRLQEAEPPPHDVVKTVRSILVRREWAIHRFDKIGIFLSLFFDDLLCANAQTILTHSHFKHPRPSTLDPSRRAARARAAAVNDGNCTISGIGDPRSLAKINRTATAERGDGRGMHIPRVCSFQPPEPSQQHGCTTCKPSGGTRLHEGPRKQVTLQENTSDLVEGNNSMEKGIKIKKEERRVGKDYHARWMKQNKTKSKI
jgi:hypothetical protein